MIFHNSFAYVNSFFASLMYSISVPLHYLIISFISFPFKLSHKSLEINEPFLIAVKKGIPSDDELQDLSVRISDWKKLGRKLKFDEAKLTGFARDNDEFSEKALAMLMAWKRRDGSDASYQVLFEALSHSYVSRRDLAEDICCHFN